MYFKINEGSVSRNVNSLPTVLTVWLVNMNVDKRAMHFYIANATVSICNLIGYMYRVHVRAYIHDSKLVC